MRIMRAIVVGLGLSSSLFAQEAPAPLSIARTSAAITLDGDLSDPGWLNAAKIDRFYETSPGNNTEPRVKTLAYVTYDARYFYIGIRAEDPEPQRIRAPFVERDAVIGTDDNIAIFLDTRNDKRSAIELRVNPRGIQGDAIFNDANGNEDFSPDFFYDTAAKIDAQGWSAEFRIPFSSLRYPRSDPQTWNMLVWRNYPREFRFQYHSAPLPRGSNCLVCHAHPLNGLTDLPAAGHLVAAPYVTAQRVDEPRFGAGSRLDSGSTKAETGGDIKWNPTATNTFDLTVNPDFSQVESDVAQITVNQRFAVFYPEKRPFFLEGFDLFDTPMRVAYTRTINSPRWGLRGTGKVGGSAYTILISQDRGGGLTVLPSPLGSQYSPQDKRAFSTIARVRHDLGASFVGAVLTDLELRGGSHNRVVGPDFQWRPNDSDAITAQALYSDSGDRKGHAVIANWNRVQTKYDAFVELRDIADNFRADLGFIPQVGYRSGTGNIAARWFPEKSLFSFVRANLRYDYQWNDDGTIQRTIEPGIFIQGAKNLAIDSWLTPRQRIRVGNRLLTQSFGNFNIQFDPSRRVPRVSFGVRAGQNADLDSSRVGRGLLLYSTATLRPIDRLTFDLNVNRETLDVGGARAFTALIERLKTTYSFSSKSLVRMIGQYVKTTFPGSRNGDFAGSVLYSYRLNWQTVLFLGYGDDRTLMPEGSLARAQRSFFTKVSYAIQR